MLGRVTALGVAVVLVYLVALKWGTAPAVAGFGLLLLGTLLGDRGAGPAPRVRDSTGPTDDVRGPP